MAFYICDIPTKNPKLPTNHEKFPIEVHPATYLTRPAKTVQILQFLEKLPQPRGNLGDVTTK